MEVGKTMQYVSYLGRIWISSEKASGDIVTTVVDKALQMSYLSLQLITHFLIFSSLSYLCLKPEIFTHLGSEFPKKIQQNQKYS